MSVARNVWRPADISHIVPATVVDSETAQRLIASCPAGLFSLTAEGELRVSFRGCLECGTCRVLCGDTILTQWEYPLGTFGVDFRYG